MATATLVERDTAQRDALAQRLFSAAIGMMDVVSVYLGDRLGLYAALAARDWVTAAELAAATGTQERYVREWLEQQAVTGLLDVDAVAADPPARRYQLPDAYREVLLDEDSLSYLSGLVRLVVGACSPLPALLDAFRHGGGVPYPAYGPDTREGIAAMNRPMFVNQLATEWLPAVPDLHARLLTSPLARVADVGCGAGWSSIAIARAYPNAWVDGFDPDEDSITLARANATAAGVADRVRFLACDGADPTLTGRYDLVTAFETIHDMAQPVAVLRNIRRLVRDGGAVIVADERVAERFTVPGDDVERLNYGFSVLHCLPVGLAETPSAGTGTVLRPARLREYALEAGFQDVEVLPIENDFWRFYRLVP